MSSNIRSNHDQRNAEEAAGSYLDVALEFAMLAAPILGNVNDGVAFALDAHIRERETAAISGAAPVVPTVDSLFVELCETLLGASLPE
jgi:hypothetical protein